ncbi:MAG: chorismate synthase [Firmicutes bacterium]|nr:chorismate synthase [Bacillota bacterium]
MSSEWGNMLKVSVFGESHGNAIGVSVSGFPAGETVDMEELLTFLDRRKPGKNNLSTSRKEADEPNFISGIEDNTLTGTPLCAVIVNHNTRSQDYNGFGNTPRPGHADYTATIKWQGNADMRGGGHFSGRLTAPICIAGGIAKQILHKKGIDIGAHIRSVGTSEDAAFPLYPTKELFDAIAAKDFPVIDDNCGEAMKETILAAKAEEDSIGGTIECAVIGLPTGLGGPLFGGMEGKISAAMFGIPAVKGIEFGAGFHSSKMRGSENNDAFCFDEQGNVATETNHCGGILGGITNGMPLTFRLACKPTPSIARPQQTVDLSKKEITEIRIEGRHDPCIVHRAVPVVEAVAALVILDTLLEERK